MSVSKIKGVITALATPFKDGAVDKKSFVRLLRRQLNWGVDGFVVNGTTAESPALSREEAKDLFAIAQSEVAGAVPLIAGTGTNSTAGTIELTRDFCRLKPDAVLVVVSPITTGPLSAASYNTLRRWRKIRPSRFCSMMFPRAPWPHSVPKRWRNFAGKKIFSESRTPPGTWRHSRRLNPPRARILFSLRRRRILR